MTEPLAPSDIRTCPKCRHVSAVPDPKSKPQTWTCPHDYRCHGVREAPDANGDPQIHTNGPYTFRDRTPDDR